MRGKRKGKSADARPETTVVRTANKPSWWSQAVQYLVGSIVPAVPVIIVSGLTLSLLALLVALGWVQEGSGFYLLMEGVGNTPLHFLPVIIGYSAAKQLRTNEFLGILIGAILLLPSLSQQIHSAGGVVAFGLQIPPAVYTATIIPAALGVWVMSMVYRRISAALPGAAADLLSPFLTFLVMGPLMLFVLGPAGYYIGYGMSAALDALIGIGLGWLVVIIMAVIWPFLMATGIQSAFILPMILNNLATKGFDDVMTPAGLVVSFAASGMAAAVALRAKGPGLKVKAQLGAVTGAFGIIEAPVFTIAYPLRRPLIGMVVGCFVGGVLAGLLELKVFVFAISGVVALPGFIPPASMQVGNENNLVFAAITFLVTFVAAFTATWLIGMGNCESRLDPAAKIVEADAAPRPIAVGK